MRIDWLQRPDATFQEIADAWADENGTSWRDSYEAILESLFVAFWRGNFERGGESQVSLEFSREQTPVTRVFMLRAMPTGEHWMPRLIREAHFDDPQKQHFEAMESLRFCQYEDANCRRMGELVISKEDFRHWVQNSSNAVLPEFWFGYDQRTNRDQIARRVEKILSQGAAIKSRDRQRSITSIANELAPAGRHNKCQDFGSEAVKKILLGRYPPARKRGYGGLEWWVKRKFQ
jgi:hypothetical protein